MLNCICLLYIYITCTRDFLNKYNMISSSCDNWSTIQCLVVMLLSLSLSLSSLSLSWLVMSLSLMKNLWNLSQPHCLYRHISVHHSFHLILRILVLLLKFFIQCSATQSKQTLWHIEMFICRYRSRCRCSRYSWHWRRWCFR